MSMSGMLIKILLCPEQSLKKRCSRTLGLIWFYWLVFLGIKNAIYSSYESYEFEWFILDIGMID
jgi:hypothetical protein